MRSNVFCVILKIEPNLVGHGEKQDEGWKVKQDLAALVPKDFFMIMFHLGLCIRYLLFPFYFIAAS